MGADMWMEMRESDPSTIIVLIGGFEYRADNERGRDGPPGRGGQYVLRKDDEARLRLRLSAQGPTQEA